MSGKAKKSNLDRSKPPEKKANKANSKIQVELINADLGFVKRVKENTLIDQDILLTDEFYKGSIPEEAKGHLFHYWVSRWIK